MNRSASGPRLKAIWLAAAAAGALAPAAHAQTSEDLANLSIEELTQVEVTSASKQAEPLGGAPTSIFVITDEEIIRSAMTSLPEALRLAPNLQVQRINAHEYAITARGFNSVESANKLLVLIDGRSVYTPLHSGVFWELHSPLLEDLDQIEVISGPGGTLFGPNAVNGVVNITSKSAAATLGGLARATIGADERTLALRYGASLGDGAALRVYVNGFEREGLPAGPGPEIDDRTRGWQAGFRSDFGDASNGFTIQGDIFRNETYVVEGDRDRGHNILARWNRSVGDDSSVQVQAYYDDYHRRYALVTDALETFDIEAQFNGRFGIHEIVAGAGVRTTRDRFTNDLNAFVLDPESERLWIGNGFVQDRIALTPKLDMIVGVKLEQSSFTGINVLPNLRFAWQPRPETLLWAAVSRAVRTPSRIDRDLTSLPLLTQAPDFRSEKLIAFEAGYRGQPAARTSLAVSLFYNLYDDIRTTEFAPGGGLPIRLANSLKGHTYGVEASATREIASWWRAGLGIATLGKDFHLKDGVVDLSQGASLGMDPDFRIIARSSMNLTDRVQLDLGGRIVDDLEETGLGDYTELDARLSWLATDALELFVAGNNLLHATHAESNDASRAQLNERRIFAGSRIRF